MRLIAGKAFGAVSPAETFAPMFYLDVEASAGAAIPLPDDYEERAIYVAIGEITLDGMLCESGTMVVLKPGAKPEIATRHGARVMLLGGAPLAGARHLWWNFVASSPERIEQAQARSAKPRLGQACGRRFRSHGSPDN